MWYECRQLCIYLYVWRKLWLKAQAVNMNSPSIHSKRKPFTHIYSIYPYTIHIYKRKFYFFSTVFKHFIRSKNHRTTICVTYGNANETNKMMIIILLFIWKVPTSLYPPRKNSWIKCYDIQVFNSYFSFVTFKWAVQLNFGHTSQREQGNKRRRRTRRGKVCVLE